MAGLKKKAKPAAEKLYRVTVAGEYLAAIQGRIETRTYKETATLNENHKEAGFLSVMKNHFLPPALKQKYPAFQGLHTHEIVDVVDLENPGEPMEDPTLMNLSQLVGFIKENDLPIEIALYGDTDALRQAVIEYHEDEAAFLATQANRLDIHGPTLEIKADIAKLNPSLGNIDPDTPYDPDNVPDTVRVTPNTPQSPADSFVTEEDGTQTPVDTFTQGNLNQSNYDDSKPETANPNPDAEKSSTEGKTKEDGLDGI